MKNLEIPRNDSLCALCRINNANETGRSHGAKFTHFSGIVF